MQTWQAHASAVRGLAFSPDGQRLASFCQTEGHVRFWDPLTGTALGTIGLKMREKPEYWVPTCMAFSPNGQWFAVFYTRNSHILRIWDLATSPAKCVAEDNFSSVIGGLAFTGHLPPKLYATDFTRVVFIDEPFHPVMPCTMLSRGPDRKTPKASRVVVSPDGLWVASNGRPKSVVWETKELKPKSVREHPKSPNNGPIAFNPTSDLLAVGHGTKVDLWKFTEKGSVAIELSGHKLAVWGVHFTADGNTVQTVSSDGTFRTWDVATGAAKQTYDWRLGKLYSAAFAPDGLIAAAGTEDGKIIVWDNDA